MSKQRPPVPTASAIGPCHTIFQIGRTSRHWKFTQRHCTTRPPQWIRISACFTCTCTYKSYFTWDQIKMTCSQCMDCICRQVTLFFRWWCQRKLQNDFSLCYFGPSCSKLITALVNEISNIIYVKVLLFFAGKLWVAFAMQKLLTFFPQKILLQLILWVL